jgi:hypothetical protein
MHSTRTMLYVGHRARGHALSAAVQARGWQVYVPTALLEALGIYVFYYPHCVVIDDALVRSSLATEVCAHLLSIQAQQLLVVTDERRQEQWQATAVAAIRVLPRTASVPDVVPAIVDLIETSIRAHATRGQSVGEDDDTA